MQDTVEKEVRQRAYFVAGSKAWSRPANDPVVESAIRDASFYLDEIAEQGARSPTISGATTGTADSILVLYWLVQSNGGMRTIEIRFHGNGDCSVRLASLDGTESIKSHLNVKDVLALNLPSRIQQFRRPGPAISGALTPR